MTCVAIFGIFFIVYGIWVIIKKKGMVILSKRNEEVEGSKAVEQGIIAVIVGIAIVAFAYIDVIMNFLTAGK